MSLVVILGVWQDGLLRGPGPADWMEQKPGCVQKLIGEETLHKYYIYIIYII